MFLLKKYAQALLLLLVSASAISSPALQDIDGQSIPLSSLKGNWVFINFWASWCQPCLEEIPELNRFYSHYKENNVKVYAVNFDSLPIPEQKELIKSLDIKYPSLSGNPARLLKLGNIRGVPATFVFNPQGQLAKTLYGPQTAASLRRAIR